MPSSHQLLPQTDPDDIERQVENKAASTPQTTIVEDTISTRSKLIQLGFYFLCNVALTIYNKLILGKVGRLSTRSSVAHLRAPVSRLRAHSSRAVMILTS